MVRIRLALSALTLVAFAAVPVTGAAAATACSAKSITSAGGYKVVRLTESGLSCAKARTVAATVARELGRQGGVDMPGVAALSMSTVMCTGCKPRTEVSLGYASGGKVTVTLEKPGGTSTPAPGMTSPTPVLPQPGPGPGYTV